LRKEPLREEDRSRGGPSAEGHRLQNSSPVCDPRAEASLPVAGTAPPVRRLRNEAVEPLHEEDLRLVVYTYTQV
jgi:hypothetical protein